VCAAVEEEKVAAPGDGESAPSEAAEEREG
jgi:hypothetical protein